MDLSGMAYFPSRQLIIPTYSESHHDMCPDDSSVLVGFSCSGRSDSLLGTVSIRHGL